MDAFVFHICPLRKKESNSSFRWQDNYTPRAPLAPRTVPRCLGKGQSCPKSHPSSWWLEEEVGELLIMLKHWIIREAKSYCWVSQFQNCPAVESGEYALALALHWEKSVWLAFWAEFMHCVPRKSHNWWRRFGSWSWLCFLVSSWHNLALVKWFLACSTIAER